MSQLTAKRKAAVIQFNGELRKDVGGLQVGDRVPDFEIKVINHSKFTTHLFEFKGKFIILDFWATWCSSCVNSFPKINQLQYLYQDKLQFLLVNTSSSQDSEKGLRNFVDKLTLPFGAKFRLPSIISDTFAAFLFPHKMIPHYVWIDDKMEVKAITTSEFLNEAYISKFVNGKSLDIPEKKDLSFDPSKPIFFKGNGGVNDSFLFRTILAGYQEGLPSSSGMVYDKRMRVARIFSTNASIESLYRQAYSELDSIPHNRLTIHGKKLAKYRVEGEWTSLNMSKAYNYELIVPSKSIREARSFMQSDLERYFGFSLSVKKILSKCLVIEIIDSSAIKFSESDVYESNLEVDEYSSKFMKGGTISDLVGVLNAIVQWPVLDETNLKRKIDLEKLPGKIDDILLLRLALRANGFGLLECEKEIRVFILSENEREN
jgi:thiol-disulfide isomerase/thioredoxin